MKGRKEERKETYGRQATKEDARPEARRSERIMTDVDSDAA